MSEPASSEHERPRPSASPGDTGPAAAPSPSPLPPPPTSVPQPAIINKHALSNLNRTLKAKQKGIKHAGGGVASGVTSGPSTFANAPAMGDASEAKDDGGDEVTSVADDNDQSKRHQKVKRISKQASTKTDFFAAKLASAVHGCDSSDSDETFVYDQPQAPDAASSAVGSVYSPSVVDGAAPEPDLGAGALEWAPGGTGTASASLFAGAHSGPHSVRSVSEMSLPDTNNDAANTKLRPRKSMSTVASRHNDDTLATIKGCSGSPGPSVGASVGGANDDHYSYDEVDADDDLSSDGDDSDGDQRAPSQAPALNTPPTKSQAAAPPRRKKSPSTTSSSKLRSTTSKLFDKKGSQPRRYSIIPHDIDIDDFDDDLIYYDQARFPYMSSSGTNTPGDVPSFCGPPLAAAAPQTSASAHKLPHARSLNLASKKKHHRYFSMGAPAAAGAAGAAASPVAPGSPATASPGHGATISGHPTPPLQQQQQPTWTTGLLPSSPRHYDTFDEEPLLQNPAKELRKQTSFASSRYHNPMMSSPHDLYRIKSEEFARRGRYQCLRSFIYTLLSVVFIMTVGFSLGFILATTKQLEDVQISSIDQAVVASDELVFNVAVSAVNPGWFTIDIADVDLSVFAKSGYLDDPDSPHHYAVETVVLGSVYQFSSPISFTGGVFNSERQTQVAEVKLVGPGRNVTGLDSDSKDNWNKWNRIIKHPFDLILRGNLQYKLPMSSQPRFVSVNKVAYIDPNSD
ncbi:hypothetical protein DIURU_001830 [Diutina rugosa]|uniref:Uncharacterized protein n=1 Tax=Diutina rugosa TaxID=5481 RepID=A0A642UXI8_DIURU|nr:uncharacterized protein DIURU_001830 [Diutina rugosa]KAA8904754.1 hypothetical protein DIURU_001830 [Diutina rugosa]